VISFILYYAFTFSEDAEVKKVGLEKFTTTTLPKALAPLETRLKNNSSQHHIVGDKWTIADFTIAAAAYSVFLNEANPNYAEFLPIVKEFPVLYAYFLHLGEDLKEYLATRP